MTNKIGINDSVVAHAVTVSLFSILIFVPVLLLNLRKLEAEMAKLNCAFVLLSLVREPDSFTRRKKESGIG